MTASTESSREWFKEKGWHFDSNNDFVDKDGRSCSSIVAMIKSCFVPDIDAPQIITTIRSTVGNLFDFESQQEHYEYLHRKHKGKDHVPRLH